MENNERVLTCVYCGQEYPQGTPASGSEILTNHIKVCEKHPMRKSEETIKSLQNALGDLIGAHTIVELDEIRCGLIVLRAKIGDSDIDASIRAIDALKLSMEN